MSESPEPHAEAPESELVVSILLVDDDASNLLALRALLDGCGLNFVEARSGEEAIRLIETEEFAVILLEVQLPGLSGFETANAVRRQERSRHTPIIFLTSGSIARDQMEQGYALGAVDFLTRPFWAIPIQAKVRGFAELFREKALAKREAEQLRLLVHGTTEYAIFMLDASGRVATWNPGAQRLKGYSAEEIIGTHFSRFYPDEAIARRWPQYELEVARQVGRFEDEGWRVRKDGSLFWANVVITALYDAVGGFRGFSKITRDLTERKKSEENVRQLIEETAARRAAEENARLMLEQRERLHVTLASIGDAVISTDSTGRVVFLNPIAVELTGWTNDEAANQNLSDVFHIVNEDTRLPVDNPALRALREGRIVGLANHTILISRQGIERPIDDSAAPMRDADGRVIGSVLVFRDISERKQSETDLRQSESRFRGLMEQAPFSIQVFAPDGRTLRVNRAWEELWGITLEQVADYNILNDQQLESKGVLSYIRQAFAGYPSQVPAIEYDPNETIPNRTRHHDARRWVSAVAYPLKDDSGNVQEVILVHDDITSRQKADTDLRESERRLRLALEAGRMGVWEWNLRTNKVNSSESLEQLHGLTRGTFDGTFAGLQRLIHPSDREMMARAIQQAIEEGTGYDIEFRNAAANGGVHWIAGKGMVFAGADGKPERVIGVAMDVTQRRRSEQIARFLADASATLADLVDFNSTLQRVAALAVPHFADWATVDLVEKGGSLNRVAVAHVDPVKVTLAHDLHRRFPPNPAAPRGTWNILRTGEAEMVTEISEKLLADLVKDEELLAIVQQLGLKSYIGVPLKAHGKTLGVITFLSAESGHLYESSDLAVAQELADRGAMAIENTSLYRELRDTDRRKDEFLATLAHELRNPLAPIRNSLQILKLPGVDPQTAQQTRDIMERQVQHLVRLVDDLLDVSRVMRGKIELRKEHVELAAVVARAVELANPLIDARQHQLHVSVPNDSLLLDADPVRLIQVIGNLLTNAAKYTEAQGQIWITVQKEKKHALLSIRDDGIGIAPDVLPHIFELFVQAEHSSSKAQGGLGIGLTLVQSLVEMHGGTVQGTSPGLGEGSEFIVRLPLLGQQESRRETESSEKIETVPSLSYRLMVVDDNRDAAMSLAMLLRLRGHEVQIAHDGPTALEVAATFRPDLIFLDIGMPGMDGYEVARRVRKTPGLEHTVLAALTGWGQKEDRRRTTEAGFDHHLVKPPEPQMVENLLSELQKQT